MSTSYGVNEWLKFDVGSGNTKFIGYYRIWARGGPNEADALSLAESLPTDWRIEGSNDDANWTTLDTRSGVNNADIAHQSSATGTLTNYPHKEYQIQNPGAYRYYRLWVVSTASSGGVIISELAYYEIDSQIPRAVGSLEYNLFTDKKFGNDNLGNIGEVTHAASSSSGMDYWAYDPSDNTVVVSFVDAGTVLKMCKINLDGTVVTPDSTKYSANIQPTSQADLLAEYASGTTFGPGSVHVFSFTPHALFDLAVNDSPAFHVFDEDATTQWVSHSNRYDVTTGDAVQTGFSGTPPSTITFATTPVWTGLEYRSYNVTSTFVEYKLHDDTANGGAILSPDIYALTFEINGSNQLILDVDPPTTGSSSPAEFDINGGGGSTMTSGAVTPGDTITLYNSSNAVVATMTVPSELAVVPSKLASTTDAGEYLKLDLGLAITATTLNLKSITEYKEPIINMTGYSQCGYEVSASSEYNTTAYMAWQVFDNLRTGSPNTYDDVWGSSGTSYDSGNSWNANTARQLATNTEYGEWVKLKLPDRRKLVAYKLSREDSTSIVAAPRKFRLYGSNDDSTWTEIVGSAVTRGATDPINSKTQTPNADSTSGSRFDLATVSPAYQYFALVIEQTHSYSRTVFQEFELFCQPSEISEFKLYGSPDDAAWTEIHAQTSANITSSGTDFTITNSGSYQYYGLVITKNTGFHNVSLAEMKLGTELDPLICKARASYVHTGGSSGTATLSNDVNIAASPSIGTIIANIPSPWNISGAHYSIYPVTFSFATARTSTNYQVLVSESTTLGNLNVVMNTCVRNKTTTDFIVNVMVYETSSSGNLKWGIDFVVF